MNVIVDHGVVPGGFILDREADPDPAGTGLGDFIPRHRDVPATLVQTDAVDAGRSQGNLYSRLQSQIDAARESYRKEFASGDIPDYLHLEIVKTLANNDATTLGSDYPGSLV